METQQPHFKPLTIETTAKAQVQLDPQAEVEVEPEGAESATISSTDDERKRETQRQAWFENAIKKELKIPNSYVQVAPLIIRWDPEVDDYDPGHSEEIEHLNRVFERFGFSRSTEVRLNPKVQKPQYALNSAITAHIGAHDGQNKLMIIYYTGHGILDADKRLLLAARRNEDERQGGNNLAVAYWHKAEAPLLDEEVEGDVLTIFDCCFASDAHKGRHHSRRIYDLLAACPEGGSTPAPGKTSFTRSLINTLDRLWDADHDQRILTTRLLEEMSRNKGTQAKLHDRLHKDDGRHVQLTLINGQSREETEQVAEDFNSSPLEEAGVKLRFSLQAKDLTRPKIEKWAQHLVKASQDASIPLRRIDWLRLESNEPGQRLRNVANIFRERNLSNSPPRDSGPLREPQSPSPCRRTEQQRRERNLVLDSSLKTTLSIPESELDVCCDDYASYPRHKVVRIKPRTFERLHARVAVPLPWFLCLLMFAVSFLVSRFSQLAQRYPILPDL